MKKIIFGVLTLCVVLAGCGSRTTDTIKVSSSTESSTSVTKPISEISASLDISNQKNKLETSSQEPTVSNSEDENIWQKSNVQVSDDKDIWQEPSVQVSDDEDIWQEPSVQVSDDEDIWQKPSVQVSDDEDIWQESYVQISDDEDIWQKPSVQVSDDEDIWQESSVQVSDDEDIWQEPPIQVSDDEDIWQESSVQVSDNEDIWLANPDDTRFAYGICKQNCYVEVANSENYPLYKGQQVTICYINDTTYDIMWYPSTGTVSKDCIEQYPDDFIPDFSKGQWAGCIYAESGSQTSTILAYGICNKTCTLKVDQGATQELYKGQQIGIVAYRDDLAQILWYDTSAFVPIECIEFYPESFQPDFSRGQWAGVITK